MKRIIAFALVLIFCLSFASCAKDDAPEGMHLVSIDGEPFKLYVPKAWKNNSSSGISGAYYSSAEKITVSARYYASDEDIGLDEYAEQCESEYALTLADYESKGISESVVAGENARELVFIFEDDKTDYTCRTLIVKYNGDFIHLSFYCPSARFEELNADQFDAIVEEFRLCEREEDTGDAVTDKHTPDSMKIASSDNVEYVMYVPTSWICNSESGMSEAYFDESGRPNVTVTSYSYDESVLTPEQYFEKCEDEYEDVLADINERDKNTGAVMLSFDKKTVVAKFYNFVGIAFCLRNF